MPSSAVIFDFFFLFRVFFSAHLKLISNTARPFPPPFLIIKLKKALYLNKAASVNMKRSSPYIYSNTKVKNYSFTLLRIPLGVFQTEYSRLYILNAICANSTHAENAVHCKKIEGGAMETSHPKLMLYL